jgi:hypothetical protein
MTTRNRQIVSDVIGCVYATMNLKSLQLIGCTVLLALMGIASLLGSDHDADFMVVTYDPEIEQALQISKADMLRNRRVKNGVIGFGPGGNYNGIWMIDSSFLMSAYRYWGPEFRDFLYSDKPGALGLVPRFAAVQAPDGLIPMAIRGDEGWIEYGGRLDLAQNRKENRDLENPYTFVHVNYVDWRDTADLAYVRRYRNAMQRAVELIDRRRDAATGLILMTYGIPNSDVCVDYAVPQSMAEPYFNALYVRAYLEYADLAEALEDAAEAKVYRTKAEALRQAINRHCWIPARTRYEMRILRTPVSSDPTLPASAIKEDTRFPVVDNMLLIYYGIPDSQERVKALVHLINETEKGLAVVGRTVVPPYPDGFITRHKLFDGGNYHNGEVWTWFSNQYGIALYRLGYPASADHVLRSQARVAIRDQGFSEYYEDDAKGAAKGAFHYGATAATFQSAVVEGLFGLELDAPSHTLSVHPSLSHSGKLRVRLGGKPAEVSLDIQPQREEMLLRVESGLSVQGDFRVMVPEGFKAGGKWAVIRQSVAKSEPVRCSVVSLGEATYVQFKAELAPGAQAFRLRLGEGSTTGIATPKSAAAQRGH